MIPQYQNLIVLSILVLLSLIASYILYEILESTGQGKYGAVSLGGAAAGFVVFFHMFKWGYNDLNKGSMGNIEVLLDFGIETPPIDRDIASCKIRRIDENGKVKEQNVAIIFSEGNPQINIQNVSRGEYFQIMVQDNEVIWESYYESPKLRRIALEKKTKRGSHDET